MKEHIALIHDGKKYFKCKLCGKNFGECNNLLKHSSFHHKNKVLFKCIICGSKFAD